jgi:glyoxylase-like metal-dependent hydrolase (beta-lactamase superfamily II)/ferredoxin
MADKNKIVEGNVAGDFFVDTTCINCDNCREMVPEVFGRFGSYAGVKRQPQSAEEIHLSLQALVCCPTGSIGTHEKHDIKSVIDEFPILIDENIYYFGFNSPKGAGGKSYFVKHPNGNWMIDSPKFQPRLLEWIQANGGLKYIFLTHRDDVADAGSYATKLNANRIIHIEDIESQPHAEMILEGLNPLTLDNDFIIIPTPGHTEGHCMLLYKNKYLFSGDVLTANFRYHEGLEVWPPLYCWYSWGEQIKSLERLQKYDFERILPAHGRRYSCDPSKMKEQLANVIERSKSEPDPNPCTPERIAFLERLAVFFDEQGQPVYADTMRMRAEAANLRAAEMR